VVVSPLPAAVEGMAVRIDEPAADAIGGIEPAPSEPTGAHAGPT